MSLNVTNLVRAAAHSAVFTYRPSLSYSYTLLGPVLCIPFSVMHTKVSRSIANNYKRHDYKRSH